MRLLRGESIEEWSREVGVEVYRRAKWRDRALAGIDAVLKECAKDDPVQAELDAAHRQSGEITMENEPLRRKIERVGRKGPLGRGRSNKCAARPPKAEPISQGLIKHFGGIGRDLARGLIVHHDQGT